MTKQEYLDQRNALLAEADALIEENKSEEFNAKVQEIEDLDNKYEDIKKANANLNALKDNAKVLDLENESVLIKGGKKMAILETNVENICATEDYRNGYFKRLLGRELSIQENAAVSAASVIPTVTMNKIIEKLEQTSVLYNRITVTSFPNKLTIPRENAKNDASWVAMSVASNDSADSFDYVTLGANKLIKTIEIDADVMSMSIDVFEMFIVNALSKKMSKAVENAILNGNGTNQPTGLLHAGEITNTGTYTKAGMTYADLMAIIADLPTPYHQNAVFVTTREVFFNEIMGMLTTSGEPVVVMDPQAPTKFNVLGYPVIIDDYVGTDKLLFGDLSYYYFNWARNVEINADNSVAFRTGSTVYRSMALADGKLVLPEAFTLYTRAS